MARFTLPRDLYYGKNSLETLKTLKGKKAIIVVGGGEIRHRGTTEEVFPLIMADTLGSCPVLNR